MNSFKATNIIADFFMLQHVCKKCQLQIGMSREKSYALDEYKFRAK